MEANGMQHNHSERRRFPRVRVSLGVNFIFLADKTHSGNGITKDLSAGGMCLITYKEVDINEQLLLQFKLPQSNTLYSIKSKVVWRAEYTFSLIQQNRYDLGLEFFEVDSQTQQTIHQFVLEQLQNSQA